MPETIYKLQISYKRMGLIKNFFDFIFHIDKYINIIIQNYGNIAYFILFLIIFLETGFVLTPFLPGDSLIFIIGTFAAYGNLNITLLFIILTTAAILGDTVNYWIGNFFGEKVFSKSRFFKQEYLARTKEFYKKHGGKTIIIARFIPIIRTFAPFVAGIGNMKYLRFLSFNVIGGISWVAIFLFAGYFFGTIPLIKENLTLITFLIILISLIPSLKEIYNMKKKNP